VPSCRILEALQIVFDIQPFQLLRDMGKKLRGIIVGLIEQAHSKIDLARQIVVAPGKRRSASFTEGPGDARISHHLSSRIRREGHRCLVKSREGRNKCSRHAAAIGAMAIGAFSTWIVVAPQ